MAAVAVISRSLSVRVVAAEQHDADPRHVLGDALGGFDTGAVGHMHVEEHDIRQNVLRAFARVTTSGYLCHDSVAECTQEIDE